MNDRRNKDTKANGEFDRRKRPSVVWSGGDFDHELMDQMSKYAFVGLGFLVGFFFFVAIS
jgi:hypothetical protein